jgi:quercetin dioxygenase-like cupin family protein
VTGIPRVPDRLTRRAAVARSDLYVLQNTIPPGKTFGWHSHPGPSLVIVKSGTATFYLAADPTCAPQVVPAGSGFVDQGHDVHVVRNEGSVDLVTVVVSLVPRGSPGGSTSRAPAACRTAELAERQGESLRRAHWSGEPGWKWISHRVQR